MTQRENFLRAIRFERPDYIPMRFAINDSCWNTYDNQTLYDLMEEHSFLFPNFKRPKDNVKRVFNGIQKKGTPFIDSFGCVWETTMDGITGTVTKNPLASWDDFLSYKMPNPNICNGLECVDWCEIKENINNAKNQGLFTEGGLRHGHTFLQLCDIRGYENIIYDMADEEPNLLKLINQLESFNMQIILKYIEMGVDMISYPEDLGMQNGPMLSPNHFARYINPSYKRLMKPAIDSGAIVHMHSDGHLHTLINDMMNSGIDVINLQDLVNGIDWIADKFAGKICVDLDIDRQSITAMGNPKQIDALIKEEVEKLSTKQGGLIMIYGLYPGIPIENIKALMDAMEKYSEGLSN